MASINKWLLSTAIFCLFNSSLQAQTADELFNQKKTQLKYLAEQIVALRVYAGYVNDGYEIVSDGVQSVAGLKNGEFNLHDIFFKSLKLVKPSIINSGKVAEILSLQLAIIKSLNKIEKLQYLSASQREYIGSIKTRVFEECHNDLEELSLVMTAGQLEMKDEERIKRIDKIHATISDKMSFTQSLYNEVSILVHQKEAKSSQLFKLVIYLKMIKKTINAITFHFRTGLMIIILSTICLKHSMAQSHEVQQLLLNVEKLSQLKNVLADMKKGYQIVSSGYGAVKDITQGNFSLHEVFLDGLMLVNPEIKKYYRVKDIINYQKSILSEYKTAYKRFNASGNFSQAEIEYLAKVYRQLANQSLDNLEDLANVITSSKLRMSDDERLKAIDRIFEDTQDKLLFLRNFNRQASILNLQRTKEKSDLATTQKLY